MLDFSPEEAENWLVSVIQSAKRDAENKRIRCSDASSNVPVVYFDETYELDAVAYLRVAEAHARSRRGSAPQKAEYWIGKLERHYDAAKGLFVETYGENAVGNDEQEESLSPYASLIRRERSPPPRQTHASGDSSTQRAKAAAIVRNLQPTVDCYNALIEAWGHDKDTISVVRSRRWLTKLEDEAKNDDNRSVLRLPLRPNAQSYDLYLNSCSRGLGRHAKLLKERAEEAEKLLEYRLSPGAPASVRPTTESFNYVLRAWTRCRKEAGVANKVMDLVLQMERIKKEHLLAVEKGLDVEEEERWKGQVSPDTKTYSMALDGWIVLAGLKAEKWRGSETARLNKVKQRAASRKGGDEQPQNDGTDSGNADDGTKEMEKAETILKYVTDLARVGLADVHATVISYNTLLSGWARLANEIRPDIPLKSEKLLHEMIDMAEQGNENAAPDVTTFNAIIKAWGRTKRPNSADRCEFWLRRMISESKSNGNGRTFIVPPNVSTYNLVMDAHLQLGDPARVQDLLLEMDASEDVMPNNESFSKVIRAWLHDELHNVYGLPGSSVENAWTWLEELLHREEKGDVDLGPAPEMFSAIIKTAARSSAKGENMLTVGTLALRAMKASRFPPDHLVYVWLLEIALKVLPSLESNEKREEVITICRQCCDNGLLSSKFLKTLCRSSSREGSRWTSEELNRVFKELLSEQPFPTTWSRNLKGGEELKPQPSDLVCEVKVNPRQGSGRGNPRKGKGR